MPTPTAPPLRPCDARLGASLCKSRRTVSTPHNEEIPGPSGLRPHSTCFRDCTRFTFTHGGGRVPSGHATASTSSPHFLISYFSVADKATVSGLGLNRSACVTRTPGHKKRRARHDSGRSIRCGRDVNSGNLGEGNVLRGRGAKRKHARHSFSSFEGRRAGGRLFGFDVKSFRLCSVRGRRKDVQNKDMHTKE